MHSAHESVSPSVNPLIYYSLQAVPCAKPITQPTSLSSGQLVIICEREDIELGQALSGKLKGSGLKISAVSYKTLRIQPLFLKESHPQTVLVVLPRLLTVGAEETELRQATTRLYTILNSLQHYQPANLLVAQFSDGQFGIDPASNPHLEQVGWRSVLAAWSQQNPHCKARLIDCDSATPLGAWSDLIIAALQMPKPFQTLARRKEEYYELHPVKWEFTGATQALPFKPQTVLMAIGVQSPLVTIYAATIAQQTGAYLALVGQEALATNETMQRVVHHCQQAGIRVQYYTCDLNRESSVAATIQQIQLDYEAPIKTLIYGALNSPEMLNKATESVDQVLGVVQLTQHLPQLVWWLSLVSADSLLGTKQDYWSGYTAELIHAYLMSYQKTHPSLQVQMVGIEAIPVNKGVDALLPIASMQISTPLFIGQAQSLALWGKIFNPHTTEQEPSAPLVSLSEELNLSVPTTAEQAQAFSETSQSDASPFIPDTHSSESSDNQENTHQLASEHVEKALDKEINDSKGDLVSHADLSNPIAQETNSTTTALVSVHESNAEAILSTQEEGGVIPSPMVVVSSTTTPAPEIEKEVALNNSAIESPAVLAPPLVTEQLSEPIPANDVSVSEQNLVPNFVRKLQEKGSRLWLEQCFTDQITPTNSYLTIHEFGRWQAELSLATLRPIVASILNAELRILTNHVDCLDLLMDGHQETTTRVYINDFTTNRLVLRYEHWGKQTSGAYYQAAQGNVILGYGVRCLERWLELPFPVEMVEKIRGFLSS